MGNATTKWKKKAQNSLVNFCQELSNRSFVRVVSVGFCNDTLSLFVIGHHHQSLLKEEETKTNGGNVMTEGLTLAL